MFIHIIVYNNYYNYYKIWYMRKQMWICKFDFTSNIMQLIVNSIWIKFRKEKNKNIYIIYDCILKSIYKIE